MIRTVIKNGLVVDPANRICSKLDVAIEEGKIAEISSSSLSGENSIDAQGLVVAPGFVDLHMHEDPYNALEDRFEFDVLECMLRMGVTTAIGGNCGIGPEKPDVYLDAADRLGLPVNLGLLVPHGSLRALVELKDRYQEAPLHKIEAMARLAEGFLDSGCLGISYGIRYIPGLNDLEMSSINRAAYRSQKLVAAHIRDDAAAVIAAAKEFIQSGVEAGVPIQISHIGSMGAYGQMAELLAMMDSYRANGLDIAADCYPYIAFSTAIGSATFDEGFIARYGGDYDRIEVAEGEFKGQRLNEALYRELRAKHPETLLIGHVMNEAEVDLALNHPNVIMASDGILNKSQGHPRAAGSFPRFIRKYVYEKRQMGLCEAIAKMTCQPAQRIGIRKGTLSIGADADVTMFDCTGICDEASFSEPTLSPKGIRAVWIGGELAMMDGRIIKGNLGKSIRK